MFRQFESTEKSARYLLDIEIKQNGKSVPLQARGAQ